MLYKAWDRVTEKTIKNCFRHANFVRAATNHRVDSPDSDEENDLPLAAPRLRLPFEVDRTIITTEAVTDKTSWTTSLRREFKEIEDEEEEKEPGSRQRRSPIYKKLMPPSKIYKTESR